jgi:hypothetical protein
LPATERPSDLLVDDGAACGHGTNRFRERSVAEHPVLQQVADAAALVGEELAGVQLLHVLRQHKHWQTGTGPPRFEGDLKAIAV